MPDGQGFDAAIRRELVSNAVLIDLPEREFLTRMKPRARQTMTYRLNTHCRDLGLEITMSAAGVARAQFSHASVVIENGQMRFIDGAEHMCWFDTGEEARIQTRLGRSHIRDGVTAEIVVDAFLDAFGVHRDARVADGYGRWMEAMQMYAEYAAAVAKGSVQIVHQLPLMVPATMSRPEPGQAQPVVSNPDTTVHDVSDLDYPIDMPEHLDSIATLQERYEPTAMELVLAMPNLLFRRPHQEMFESEPGAVGAEALMSRLREHVGCGERAMTG